jgi:hypothetical protein
MRFDRFPKGPAMTVDLIHLVLSVIFAGISFFAARILLVRPRTSRR